MGKYGKRGCGVPESDLGPHQARFFPFPVALFFRIALVVHFLALGQADFGLDPTTLVMQIERHEGVSGAFDLADQAIDLCRVQEEFAALGYKESMNPDETLSVIRRLFHGSRIGGSKNFWRR